jgi:hypothetical protein
MFQLPEIRRLSLYQSQDHARGAENIPCHAGKTSPLM